MSSRWHGGKGSKSRTKDQKTYSDNWDAIFGKKKDKEEAYKAVNEVLREEKLKGENNENIR